MADAPDLAVANKLADVLGSGWSVGTNIFTGPVLPSGAGVPDEAVFCLATGGVAPEIVMGTPPVSSYKKPVVQVWVRSDVNDYAGGETIARTAQNGLHASSVDGYIGCYAQQAQPIYLQSDASNRYEFSLNVELWIVE